jgi:hypothetical protein
MTDAWYQWNGTTWLAVGGDPRSTSIVLGQTATLTDSAGVVWALANVNFGQVTRNNVTDTTSNNVTELAYVNGVMWRFVSSTGLWSSWNGSAAPPQISSTPAGQSFTDASGNIWTINPAVNGGAVFENGAAAGSTGNVIELADVGGVIWTENSSGNWYSYNATTKQWTAGPAPSLVGTVVWSTGTRTSPLGTITRNPWEHPGGAGSCWNTPIGLGAVVGLNTDLDTIDIARGWKPSIVTISGPFASPLAQPPLVVSGISGTTAPDIISLNWNVSPGSSGYYVYTATSATGPFTLATQVSTNSAIIAVPG